MQASGFPPANRILGWVGRVIFIYRRAKDLRLYRDSVLVRDLPSYSAQHRCACLAYSLPAALHPIMVERDAVTRR